MKYNIMIRNIVQTLLSDEQIENAAKKHGIEKKYRKLSVMDLVIFLIAAAVEKSRSYREAVTLAKKYGLPEIHYSELSKRTSTLPYEVMKGIFEYTVSSCSRKFRRSIKKEKAIAEKILAIDSTTITTGKTQIKWAKFHGQKAGVKLHVQFDTEDYIPGKVEESIARDHDSKYADELTSPESVVVEDRAYGKIARFDKYSSDAEKQLFVIRIKENITFVQSRKLRGIREENSNIIDDVTCKLGTKRKRSKGRFRVVTFFDDKKKKIIVCTNLMNVTAEVIAEIYKERWKVETFFRFIKQNLNLSKIYGTTKNAVFNQLYAVLIAYVIIRYSFEQTVRVCAYSKFSMIEFIRYLRTDNFTTEVYIALLKFISKLQTVY